jgi:hypothetical protein
MNTEGKELDKAYLMPDYSKDFDDDDDEFDDDIDVDGEDEAVENFLDKQENLKNSSRMATGSSFGSNPTSTPWVNNASNNNSNNLWVNPPTTPNWGNPSNNSSWGSTPASNNWGSRPSGGFWTNNGNSWSSVGEKKEINRNKRIIFCDVLDCLVETYQSCGKPGLLPRGIYDIKFRFDVWDKLACFNPEKIYAMVPRSLLNSSNEASWMVLLEYVVCSLSEYLRSPYQVCQILLQTKMGQPKEDTMFGILRGINREEAIYLGVNSGLYGQNNRDQIAAKKCGIDYIDLATFMNSYY